MEVQKRSADPNTILKEMFGFAGFKPGQEQVISSLLAGRSAAAIFPTGAGKSLCYQLPALMLPGLTLVVSPLIALMKDQIDSLQKRGIRAERLDSSLSEDKYRRVTQDLRSGQLKMLYVSPERLGNERFLGLIKGVRLSLLAVDEAHCISSWGHNFRPDYMKLSRAYKELKVERVLALTATATPQVSDDMAKAFDIAPSDVVNTGFHRPNLQMRVSGCRDEGRKQLLVQRLEQRAAGPTIIYVTLQRHAEDIAGHLQRAGFDARPYHAGLKQEVRTKTQDDFMAGRLQIVCATIAFGMGVDKSDIRYVYHYHQPKGFESYLQETGRAGRDGNASVCELFACPDDMTVLENFVYGDTPDESSLRSFLTQLAEQGAEIDISVYSLSRAHDIRKLVVNTLLTHLELAGVIRSEGHYYGEIRYACASEGAAIASYPSKQATFLEKLFSAGHKAAKWSTLAMGDAMEKTGHERAVIMRALADLESKGHVELQLAGYRQRCRRLVDTIDVQGECTRLQAIFSEHEQREISRIRSVADYACRERCLTSALLAYFGEELDECGHCQICIGDPPARIPVRETRSLDSCDLSDLPKLIETNRGALGRPRQQARLLCGLSSPATSAQRSLKRNHLFGICEEVPFAAVLAYCTSWSASAP